MTRRAPLLVLLGLAASGILWRAFGMPTPVAAPFRAVRAAHRPSDIRLLDRHGEVVHELRTDETGRRLAWTPLQEISPALQRAVIASEDRRFYQHGGVDARAVAAVALRQVLGGPRRGASTVTMQVAALLHTQLRRSGGPRTVGQKWRQMRLAWAIERHWSKPEILEAYLNLVTFRGELQGSAAAASVLFGKAPHGITESEAAVLAALLRAPNAGQAEVVIRRAWALRNAMGGAASRQAIVATVARALGAPAGTGPRVALAPHAARLLLPLWQGSSTASSSVRSTLDSALQRVATDSLTRHLLSARERHVQDGAILVVENQTGDVLAYIGASGDLSSARHVDGIRARRQAGSTLKPFLYGLALERRVLTSASLLEDAPIELPVAGGIYRPRNYDEQFRGLVTVRTALGGSLNVPAVRTLDLVGVETFVEQLRGLGFAGLTEAGDYYGPSLALGSADVSLWELVNAYRTLANGGIWSPLRMTPEEGEGSARRRIYTEQSAFLVSNILADRESRSVTFGLENPLATRFWSAVKTGTSKDMRDNWCVGYSRRYTVGVWVGNFSGQPMRHVSGITGAAPVWLDVMAWLHRQVPSHPPKPPTGVLARPVVFPGRREAGRTEWFLGGTEPETSAQAFAIGHPRIMAPAQGALIALDPDIPPSRQRVVFEAHDGGAPLRWVLDGADLGSATDLLMWEPLPGRHTLLLVDEAQRPHDALTFEVRGAVAHASH